METGMPEHNLGKHNWKSSLEDVSIMSDKLLADKNATWEKLHDRLNHKSGRIKVVWYWIAAACLLTAVTLFKVLPFKLPSEVVKSDVLKMPLKQGVPLRPSKGSEMVTVSTSPTRHVSISAPSVQTTAKKFLRKKVIREQVVPIVINDKKVEKDYPAVIATDSIDRIESIAIVPVKKKLRVIHINELDPAEPIIITQSEVHPSPKLKFINPETYTSFSLPIAHTGFTILKQKQAPSN